MVTVSGKLHTILDNPANARSVSVRPDGTRPTSQGVLIDEAEPADFVKATGQVSFNAQAGAATLIVRMGKRPVEIPMVIPDKPTATLRECVEARHVYSPPVVAAGVRAVNDALVAALVAVDAAKAARSSRTIPFYGTGTPSLAAFPDVKIGDVIVRVSDEFKWKVEA